MNGGALTIQDDLFFGLPPEVEPTEEELQHTREYEDVLDSLAPFRREVHDLLEPVDPEAAWRYAHCGREGTGWVGYCASCEAASPTFHAIYTPTSCMLRICPDCSNYVAAPVRDHYRPIIEYIFEHMRKGWSVKGITLTTNIMLGESEPDAAQRVIKWAVEFSEELILNHDGAGVIIALEVGEQGTKYHAHLIAYSPFLDKNRQITPTWQRITGGRGYITHVRRYESADAAIREGLKYVTKFVNLSPKQLVDLHISLKGTRRIRSRGCFYLSKNNPLREFLKKDESEPCDCPDCNSRLTWTSEREFQNLMFNRHWLIGMSVRDAVRFLRVGAGVGRSLDLTGQISHARGDP